MTIAIEANQSPQEVYDVAIEALHEYGFNVSSISLSIPLDDEYDQSIKIKQSNKRSSVGVYGALARLSL